MSEANMEMGKMIYDSACAALDSLNIKYNKIEEDLLIHFGHKGEDMNHTLILIVNTEQEVIRLVEKLPFEIDSEKSAEVAQAVCLVNDRLVCGGFTYGLDESISFEMSQIFTGSLIGEETIRRMILALAVTVEEFDDKFMALNKGYLKVDDFKAE